MYDILTKERNFSTVFKTPSMDVSVGDRVVLVDVRIIFDTIEDGDDIADDEE